MPRYSKGELTGRSAAAVSSVCSPWATSALSCRSCKGPMPIAYTAGLWKHIRENQGSEGTSQELLIFLQWDFLLCPNEAPTSHTESPGLALRLNTNFPCNHHKSFVSQHCFSTWGCSGNETKMGIWEQHSRVSCCQGVRHKHKAKDRKCIQSCCNHSNSAVPLGLSCVGAQALAHCAAYKSCFLPLLYFSLITGVPSLRDIRNTLRMIHTFSQKYETEAIYCKASFFPRSVLCVWISLQAGESCAPSLSNSLVSVPLSRLGFRYLS